jgi:glucose/arabinose dehydrogenase
LSAWALIRASRAVVPSLGDHHTNGAIAGPDGFVYFGQGTARTPAWSARTTCGSAGCHAIRSSTTPCRDVTLAGANFRTPNVLTPDPDDFVSTGALLPFGTPSRAGQVIEGRVPCNGAVMRVPAAGGSAELVAWGFRNPFGLAFAPDGSALHIVDFGVLTVGARGPEPRKETGVLWRITREGT